MKRGTSAVETLPVGRMKTILVVDDESEIRIIVETALGRSGYRIMTADSADQALKVLMENEIDLVLTDIKMPGGSGFDLMSLSQIVAKKVPIILMSGNIDIDTMIDEGLEKGAMQCIQKPFSIAELRETIESVLNPQPKKRAA